MVRTSADDALDSWELFYRNTLARLDDPGSAAPGLGAHGSIDGYAPVHDHVLGLLAPGSVLELGCCFGFLSLRVARTGRATHRLRRLTPGRSRCSPRSRRGSGCGSAP